MNVQLELMLGELGQEPSEQITQFVDPNDLSEALENAAELVVAHAAAMP
ncbi:MAG: hypothetical protein IT379_20525 [Deltaproteobacteria bacterium]|nr:hypothetical protein [Deltaproteobacteria bacterium]